MRFRMLDNEVVYRLVLKARSFYEDVIFEDKFVEKCAKKVLTTWMCALHHYRNIKINKFKDLFSELDEVIFPIRIVRSYGAFCIEIEFFDNEGKKYYMSKRSIYDYHTMSSYVIGRNNSPLEPYVDREFYYSISEDNQIKLIKTSIMKLKSDGTNDDSVIYFCYDEEETTAGMKSYALDKEIVVKYKESNSKFEENLTSHFFNIKDNRIYCNVFPILKWLSKNYDKSYTISITSKGKDGIYSQLDVEDGIVQLYVTTETMEEGEIIITKKIFAKELEEFLKENDVI